MKIKNKFFFDFFEQTHQAFYANVVPKSMMGYRLWACDTTCQKIPDNEQTRKLGTHTNQAKTVASIKLLTYFDTLNHITTRAVVFDKNTADLRCAQAQIEGIPADVISIYDRGFASFLLPTLHTHFGSKYVIRLSTTFSNTVTTFIASESVDILVNEAITKKCVTELFKLDIRKSQLDMLSYRLVKVLLSTGVTEILMTNLDESFTIDDLEVIYHERWGVETSYNYIKNTWMLGTFSGYSQKAVIQDIYCVLIAYNLQTILQVDCLPELEKVNAKRTKTYKINRNVGAGTVRSCLKNIFLNTSKVVGHAIKRVQEIIMKSLEKVKPIVKERARKLLRCNDRHQTELNYKRGL